MRNTYPWYTAENDACVPPETSITGVYDIQDPEVADEVIPWTQEEYSIAEAHMVSLHWAGDKPEDWRSPNNTKDRTIVRGYPEDWEGGILTRPWVHNNETFPE